MPKQRIDPKKVMEVIYSFYSSRKRMPSYQEICSLAGLGSKNTAHALVRKLKAQGKLHTDATGRLIPTSTPISGGSSIKLLGLIEAGFPTPSEESLHENISLDEWIIKKREASFMLRVKGDSMKDAGILNGDMVIVERTSTAKTGEIVVAEVDGSYTMKYLKKDKSGRYFLEPANKNFKPIYPTEDLKITAIVKAVIRKY